MQQPALRAVLLSLQYGISPLAGLSLVGSKCKHERCLDRRVTINDVMAPMPVAVLKAAPYDATANIDYLCVGWLAHAVPTTTQETPLFDPTIDLASLPECFEAVRGEQLQYAEWLAPVAD